MTDRIELQELPEDISKERVEVSSNVWARSPYSNGGSSPGLNNFSTELNLENVNFKLGKLDVFPRTINLNPNSDNNWVQISFELEDNIDNLDFLTSISIYNFNGEDVVKLAEEEWAHKRGTWGWEGYNESGQPVSPGTYLIVLKIEHLSKKWINRGLIQVGYY